MNAESEAHLKAADTGIYSLPLIPLVALLISFFSTTASFFVYLIIPITIIKTMVKKK
jgi:hypothetical protein